MKIRIFYGGWILALLATLIAIYGANTISNRIWILLFFIFYAISTFSLLRNHTFPKRDMGLATSWMGPLLFIAFMLASIFYFEPMKALPDPTSPTEAFVISKMNRLIFECFIGGCVEALFGYWMFFGYGLVPISALGIILFPHRRDRTERDITNYPSRWGWPVVIILLCSSWLPGFMLIQTQRRFERDMAEIKTRIQQSREKREQTPTLQK